MMTKHPIIPKHALINAVLQDIITENLPVDIQIIVYLDRQQLIKITQKNCAITLDKSGRFKLEATNFHAFFTLHEAYIQDKLLIVQYQLPNIAHLMKCLT